MIEDDRQWSYHLSNFASLRGRRQVTPAVDSNTMTQGHPDYRFICQEMWRKIQSVHPVLAESGRFMDWQKYRLGRLQSEMRTEFKKSAMEQ